VTVYKY